MLIVCLLLIIHCYSSVYTDTHDLLLFSFFSFLQRILSEIFLETKMEIINMLDNRLSHFQKHPFSYTFLKIVLVVHGSEILQ